MLLPARQSPLCTLGLCFVALVLYLFCSCPAQGQSSVLFIGDINNDPYQDTVVGRSYGGSFTKLPEKIIWGRNPIDPQPPVGPPLLNFVYPSYPRLSGSVSFLQLNSGDSQTDMMFFLWGYNDSSAVEPDTGRAVVIFGQFALSTTAVIDVGQIAPVFQSAPFFAQDVQLGTHLTEPLVRDLSDVESYLLGSFAVNVNPPDPIITHVEDSIEVRIYPNPSVYTTTIEAALPAGSYTAKVVGVNGEVFAEQRLDISSREMLWRTIDVSRLISGYYVVQLMRDGVSVGAYPFIIQR